MRLEFKILWFENQPQDVRAQVEEIEEHLQTCGFIPQIAMEIDARNLESLSRQQQLYDDFDLVVVDYDLGSEEMNGDQVARIVRRHFGFTDIIFYSGHRTVDLRDLVHKNGIDGVYCMSRPDLADKLGARIDQVVSRLSRLEAMRGLAMGTVGKCDDELRTVLEELFNSQDVRGQQTILEKLDKLVADSQSSAVEQYKKCDTLETKLNSRAVTSYHLQRMVRSLLKGMATVDEQRNTMGRYDEEVLKPRNILGHAIEARGDSGWEVTSRGADPITAADFPQLRRNLATHLKNIVAIRPLLKSDLGRERA